MRRGDVVTAAAGSGYAGKTRPAVVIQSDLFHTPSSVLICPLTSNPFEIPLVRVRIDPTSTNGLRARSWAMVDKMGAIRRDKVGAVVGALGPADISRLDEGLLVLLGLTI